MFRKMLLSILLLTLLLQLPVSVCKKEKSPCFPQISPSLARNGDLVIASFLSLYSVKVNSVRGAALFTSQPNEDCKEYQWLHKNYQQALTLIFATEEINRDTDLLPNISLGFQLYNAYHSDERTLESSLRLLSGQTKIVPNYSCKEKDKSVAVLGGATSALSVQMGTLLELYKFPQLSFGPFDPILSDKTQFPSLYQMALRDSSLHKGMVQLMVHFKWTWVGVVTTDDLRGEEFLRDLTGEMARHEVCAAFIEKIRVSERRHKESEVFFMPRIVGSSARVIVIHGDTDSLMILRYSQFPVIPSFKVWIATSDWDITMRPNYVDSYNFYGSLTFSHMMNDVPGFKSFLRTVHPNKQPEDILLKEFWLSAFKCQDGYENLKLEQCTPNASLETLPIFLFDMTMSDLSYNIYNAMYAVAWALHEILMMESETGSEESGESRVPHPCQLHSFLKSIHVKNGAGEPVFLDDKSSEAQYDIRNYLTFYNDTEFLVKVGQFIPKAPPGQDFIICDEAINWGWVDSKAPHSVCGDSCGPGNRKMPKEGEPVCCFSCSECPEGEISNQIDVDQCMKCPEDTYPDEDRVHCFPKIVTFLDVVEPLGIILALIAISFSFLTTLVLWVFVKFRNTPIVKANNRALSYTLLISLTFCFLCTLLFIGRPTAVTCLFRQTTFGVVFTVAVSSVLAKTIMVILAFRVTRPGSRIRMWVHSRVSNSVVLLCSGIQGILCGTWLATSPPFLDIDPYSEYDHIIIQCNEGSDTAFYCVLGYMGFLALCSFTVAFLAKNLPDTFNEAKYITFSMLMFCTIWISFLPTYQSTKGKSMVVVEIFAILASSAGLLGCIFIPKCYVILLRPERNTQKGIKKKSGF